MTHRLIPAAHAPFHEGHVTENISAIRQAFTRFRVSLLFAREIKARCLNRSPMKVSIVGRNIARRLSRESFFLRTAKFGIERVGDFASHLALYAEDIL